MERLPKVELKHRRRRLINFQKSTHKLPKALLPEFITLLCKSIGPAHRSYISLYRNSYSSLFETVVRVFKNLLRSSLVVLWSATTTANRFFELHSVFPKDKKLAKHLRRPFYVKKTQSCRVWSATTTANSSFEKKEQFLRKERFPTVSRLKPSLGFKQSPTY